MKKAICSLIFLSSLAGCATKPGVRLLEERSDYLSDLKVLDMSNGDAEALPKRKGEMALVWRHETELPSGDFFWGGWVSIAVNRYSLAIDKRKVVK